MSGSTLKSTAQLFGFGVLALGVAFVCSFAVRRRGRKQDDEENGTQEGTGTKQRTTKDQLPREAEHITKALLKSSDIPRVSVQGLSPDDFVRKYVAENQPVIFTDALTQDWSRAQGWTPEHLERCAPSGSTVLVAPLMADGRDKWLEDANLWPGGTAAQPLAGVIHKDRFLAVAASRIDVPVADFAASLRGQGSLPSLYADGAKNLEQSFSFLKPDIPEALEVGSSLAFKRSDLWLGGATLSTVHFDNVENLFAQLVGDKEFLLFPPQDSNRLVDGRLRKAYATWRDGRFVRETQGISDEAVLNYAAYDIHEPPEAYAEWAKKLRPTKVRVHQGEVLYLPFGWWHQVRGIPASSGLCASLAMYFEPFFARVSPKGGSRLGVLIPNPKYRKLCERLGLNDSDDDS